MNLPNRLTVARFGLTLLFVAALSIDWRFANTTGLVLFVLAGITDYFDGSIARKRNLVSDFGKLMDPLADKVMMAAAFILLVPQGAFPAWVAVVIVSREFAITGLRLLAAHKGVVLPAEKLGKHKMVWQIVTVVYFLLLLSVSEMERTGWFGVGAWWVEAWKYGGGALVHIALGLTLYSGVGYLWKNRGVITPALR
jgi:CDP-diacylglycerol---glycerol-3-phosphate 3-phosphatidyltransferase